MQRFVITLPNHLANRLRIHAKDTDRTPNDVVKSLISIGIWPKMFEDEPVQRGRDARGSKKRLLYG